MGLLMHSASNTRLSQCYVPHLKLHLTSRSETQASTATRDLCLPGYTGNVTGTWQLHRERKVGARWLKQR